MVRARPTAERPSLVRDSGRAVVGSVVSNACNVLVILVLARWLGGEAVGQYTIAFAVRALLLLACGLGMRIALTRFVAAHLARSEPDTVRGAVLAGVLVPLGVASLVAAAWFAAAGVLARDVFGDPALQVPLELVALSLPFFVLTDTALAATQGFQTMRAYVWVGQVLEPATRFGLTLVVLLLGGGVDGAAGALLAASIASAVAAVVALRRLLGTLTGGRAVVPWRELSSFAGLSWVASMATQGLLWADVVILGVLVSAAEVGAYQVAARVVLIGMFVITPLTAAMAPRIAYLWAQGDHRGVADRYQAVVLWSTRLTLPVLAGVVAVPAAVLQIFGSGFSGAVGVALLLSVGAIGEAVGAPSSVLLNQIGRNRLNMAINVSALALNITLNLLLVPLWGIEGAALAWAVTLVLGAVVRIVTVRRVATSRWPVTRPVLVALAAGLLAAGAGRGVGALVPDVPVLQVLVAAVVVSVVYLAVVVGAGLAPGERSTLGREAALRWPGLRRHRVRWQQRSAKPGTEPMSVDALISPFRVDVLARTELFAQARAHADLRRDDPDAFVALLRHGPYGVWFDEVLAARGHVDVATDDGGAQQFRRIVSAGLQLLDRHDRLGHASLGPVSVVRVPAGTALDGWRLSRDRWVLLDGGHRLALAVLDGRTTLEPSDYVVDTSGVLPPNNTLALLQAGALSSEQALAFLARGLTAHREHDGHDAPTTWTDLLEALDDPADRVHVESWAHVASSTRDGLTAS